MDALFSSKHRLFYYTLIVLLLFFTVMMCMTPQGSGTRSASDAVASESNRQAQMIQQATE